MSDGDPVDDNASVIVPVQERVRNDIRQMDVMRMEEAIRPADGTTEPGALVGNEHFQIFDIVKIFDTLQRPEQGIQLWNVSDHQISPLSFILLYVFSKIVITVT